MSCTWESLGRGFDRVQGCLNEAPFAPATFDAFFGKSNVRVRPQSLFDHGKMFGFRPRIKVDRDVVTYRGQPLCLINNRFGVFMAEKYKCNARHVLHNPVKRVHTLLGEMRN